LGLLSLTSVGRENKRIELDDRRLTLYYAIVRETKALTRTISKLLEECNEIICKFIPLIHPGLLLLTSGCRKIKELNLMTEN